MASSACAAAFNLPMFPAVDVPASAMQLVRNRRNLTALVARSD
jgi:hypothetical protein